MFLFTKTKLMVVDGIEAHGEQQRNGEQNVTYRSEIFWVKVISQV
jgi:hypothetical protein